MNRPMPAHDKEIEKVEQMGIDAALKLLWERDAAVRRFRWNDRGVLWARHFRLIVKKGVEALGVTVKCDESGNVEEVQLPISGYITDTLNKREAVSEPGLSEDISSHGYYDPCEEAMLRRGGLTDLGTYSFEEWVKNV